MKTYIGIDNGVTGSIGVINSETTEFHFTPTINQQDYTKKKQRLNRIDALSMSLILTRHKNVFAVLERPMVNNGRFKATMSAIRALESTLCILEANLIPYCFIDSKEWQREMLPSGTKTSDDLKRASLDIGKRLFPQFEYRKDADGILIAEYARRKGM